MGTGKPDLTRELFDRVSGFNNRALSLRAGLIAGSLRSVEVVIITRPATSSLGLFGQIRHEENGDYLAEGQKLLSRLGRLLDKFNRAAVLTAEQAESLTTALGNLEALSRNLLAPPSSTENQMNLLFAMLDPAEQEEAINDVPLALTRAFLLAKQADAAITIDRINIRTRAVDRAALQKALLRNSL
jgi:hypothetical protein